MQFRPFELRAYTEDVATALGGEIEPHPQVKQWRCDCPFCGGALWIIDMTWNSPGSTCVAHDPGDCDDNRVFKAIKRSLAFYLTFARSVGADAPHPASPRR